MDIPSFGTWEMLEEQFLFMLLCCYCGDTLLGVRDPTWPDFQSLLIPCYFFCYYSSDPSFLLFKAEFTLLSRAPNSLGSDSLAVSSLCVFMDTRIFLGSFFLFLVLLAFTSRLISFLGMQGMQLHLIIKSDFSFVLKIFILTKFLKQNSLNSIFLSLHYVYPSLLGTLEEFDELRVFQKKSLKRYLDFFCE